jgi:hypothetical protein
VSLPPLARDDELIGVTCRRCGRAFARGDRLRGILREAFKKGEPVRFTIDLVHAECSPPPGDFYGFV